jgi:hypothetical protein
MPVGVLLGGGSPTALTAAAREFMRDVTTTMEASLEAAMPSMPPISADALDRAREWAESVEGALSPATAAAAKRDAEAAAAKRRGEPSQSPSKATAAREDEAV